MNFCQTDLTTSFFHSSSNCRNLCTDDSWSMIWNMSPGFSCSWLPSVISPETQAKHILEKMFAFSRGFLVSCIALDLMVTGLLFKTLFRVCYCLNFEITELYFHQVSVDRRYCVEKSIVRRGDSGHVWRIGTEFHSLEGCT